MRKFPATFLMLLAFARFCFAQDAPVVQTWTATSRQKSPGETWNPIQSYMRHSERDGRVFEQTSVETMGPDGRYVVYSDTERESTRVDSTTVSVIERAFARGPNGEKTLVQERREESLTLPGGETRVVRTVLNPDADGALQVVQSEVLDSKQLNQGDRETERVVLVLGPNGLAPAAKVDSLERQNGASTIESTKSTFLRDGNGRWQLGEIREGVSQENGLQKGKKETVFRPDSSGKLEIVGRTVSVQTELGIGQSQETTASYSNIVPGVAGDSGLYLVQFETAARRNIGGEYRTARQIKRINPGSTGADLHVAQEAIDIVRPNGKGVVEEKRTIYSMDANGQLREIWVSFGETGHSF